MAGLPQFAIHSATTIYIQEFIRYPQKVKRRGEGLAHVIKLTERYLSGNAWFVFQSVALVVYSRAIAEK